MNIDKCKLGFIVPREPPSNEEGQVFLEHFNNLHNLRLKMNIENVGDIIMSDNLEAGQFYHHCVSHVGKYDETCGYCINEKAEFEVKVAKEHKEEQLKRKHKAHSQWKQATCIYCIEEMNAERPNAQNSNNSDSQTKKEQFLYADSSNTVSPDTSNIYDFTTPKKEQSTSEESHYLLLQIAVSIITIAISLGVITIPLYFFTKFLMLLYYGAEPIYLSN